MRAFSGFAWPPHRESSAANQKGALEHHKKAQLTMRWAIYFFRSGYYGTVSAMQKAASKTGQSKKTGPLCGRISHRGFNQSGQLSPQNATHRTP